MTILGQICADKWDHIEVMQAQTPLSDIQSKAKDMPATRGFKKRIQGFINENKPALIAEIKKASPSAGIIREDFDPALFAKQYQDGGAACLSVLTDTPYFQGEDRYLDMAKQACTLPALRKDFMLSPYQIHESRALGADCVLLIMAALEDAQAEDLYLLAKELGMDVLVEVHDREELERACLFSPDIIGVNNRNLKTMDVSLDTSIDLSDLIPENTIAVSESGISSAAHINSLMRFGFSTFLVGESLMRQGNLTNATKALLSVSA